MHGPIDFTSMLKAAATRIAKPHWSSHLVWWETPSEMRNYMQREQRYHEAVDAFRRMYGVNPADIRNDKSGRYYNDNLADLYYLFSRKYQHDDKFADDVDKGSFNRYDGRLFDAVGYANGPIVRPTEIVERYPKFDLNTFAGREAYARWRVKEEDRQRREEREAIIAKRQAEYDEKERIRKERAIAKEWADAKEKVDRLYGDFSKLPPPSIDLPVPSGYGNSNENAVARASSPMYAVDNK